MTAVKTLPSLVLRTWSVISLGILFLQDLDTRMNTLEVTVAAHTTDITNLVDSDVSIELRLFDLEQAVNGIRF